MDNSTHSNSEWLVRYLDGALEGDEKIRLEQQLAADKALQDELENLRLAKETIKLYGLSKKVSGIHAEMMEELKPVSPVRRISDTRRIIRYSIAVAASVLLVYLGVETYSFMNLSPGKLYSDNYQSYELATLRDNGSQVSDIEKAYREKKYYEVVSSYEAQSQKEIASIFLAGMSYLEINKTEKAVEQFRVVLKLNEIANTAIYKDPAEYYLALALLKNKDYDGALHQLRQIKNDPSHTYHEKITGKLLRKVKRLERR
jgi:predicted negative regulator of RcsB-dependent stress response